MPLATINLYMVYCSSLIATFEGSHFFFCFQIKSRPVIFEISLQIPIDKEQFNVKCLFDSLPSLHQMHQPSLALFPFFIMSHVSVLF